MVTVLTWSLAVIFGLFVLVGFVTFVAWALGLSEMDAEERKEFHMGGGL